MAGQAAVSYTWDRANRLTGIRQGTSSVALQYDAANRRTQLALPDGIVVGYTYDSDSRVTGMTWTLGGSQIDDLAYSYDADGHVVEETGSTTATATPEPYVVGLGTFNADNEMTGFLTGSMTYDANGNLTSDGSNTYTWDARNHLSAINSAATYVYDALNRRVSKVVAGTTTQLVYDGLNPVQELQSGSASANLLTGLNLDEYFQRTDSAGARDFLTDALGSTWGLADSSGTVQSGYSYEPFGYKVTSGASSTNPYQYTGRENDGGVGPFSTDLYYYRARYYSPVLQRFMSQDPIDFGGGDTNLYAYAGSDPTNAIDPLGLAACIYSITSHTLFCTPNAGGNVLQLGPNGVFSGQYSGTNNPDDANDPFLGPISPGQYNINKDYRPHHEDFWRLEPNPKVPGWEVYLGLARGGFELHPGSRSVGCITADKTDTNTMKQYDDIDELLNLEDPNNTLTVTP